MLRQVYDTASIGLAFLSTDYRYLLINQRLTEICGIPVEGHLNRTVRDCVPALADEVEGIVRTVVETGRPVTDIEVAGQRADQPDQRFWITHWHPMLGADGSVIGVNVAAEEITERKRAEASLKASEQQFRTLADCIPQFVWMSDAGGRIFWFNQLLAKFAAVPAEQIEGRDWLDILPPVGSGGEAWRDALRTGLPLQIELDLENKAGRRTFLTHIVPLFDAGRRLYRWIGTHIDISEQKRREEHIRFIVDELSHRTKNLLAVVMAISQQTARNAADLGDYHDRFSERLTALAHSHELLVKDRWYGASFADLVATQLKPFSEQGEVRVEAAGPELVLSPKAVQYLGLALHELATNASKHGALSGQVGRVSIRWRMDEAEHCVHLHWRESEGPLVQPPQRHGFGHVMIEQIVPRSLKGRGRLDFSPTGVRWDFAFPAQDADGDQATPAEDLQPDPIS